MHPFRIFIQATFDDYAVLNEAYNNYLLLSECSVYNILVCRNQKAEYFHFEGGPFTKHTPCLCDRALGQFAINVVVHPNKSIPRAFECA